jgi:hypothetical protein
MVYPLPDFSPRPEMEQSTTDRITFCYTRVEREENIASRTFLGNTSPLHLLYLRALIFKFITYRMLGK